MNGLDIKTAFSIVQWVVTGCVALYAHIISRAAANAADVTKLQLRVTSLEEQMRHMPDQALVAGLSGDMKAVKTEMAALRESLAPLARSVDRINDYLLTHR